MLPVVCPMKHLGCTAAQHDSTVLLPGPSWLPAAGGIPYMAPRLYRGCHCAQLGSWATQVPALCPTWLLDCAATTAGPSGMPAWHDHYHQAQCNSDTATAARPKCILCACAKNATLLFRWFKPPCCCLFVFFKSDFSVNTEYHNFEEISV